MHFALVSYTTRNPVPVFYPRYLGVINHKKLCTSLLRTLLRGHRPPKILYQSFTHVICGSHTTRNPIPIFYARKIGVIFYQKPSTRILSMFKLCVSLFPLGSVYVLSLNKFVIHHQKPSTSLLRTLFVGHKPPETLYQSFMNVIYGSYTTRNHVPVFYSRYLGVIYHQKPCISLLCTLSTCHTPP